MVISRATESAVRAMLYLASRPADISVSKRDICNAQGITPAFLIKIMQPLREAGLVKSYRGVAGGFALAKPAQEINLWDILCAIEGPLYLNKCMMAEGTCKRDATCKVHRVWRKAKDDLEHTLRQATLAELASSNLNELCELK